MEYLVHTIMYICICISFRFEHYSNISDAPTIMISTNDNPVMVYEQLVPPFCYFLCICLHFYLTTIGIKMKQIVLFS